MKLNDFIGGCQCRRDRQLATQLNETWAMDFVHDQRATGRNTRVLMVFDTFSRFSPIVDPRFSYRTKDVVAMLEATCSVVGVPQATRRARSRPGSFDEHAADLAAALLRDPPLVAGPTAGLASARASPRYPKQFSSVSEPPHVAYGNRHARCNRHVDARAKSSTAG